MMTICCMVNVLWFQHKGGECLGLPWELWILYPQDKIGLVEFIKAMLQTWIIIKNHFWTQNKSNKIQTDVFSHYLNQMSRKDMLCFCPPPPHPFSVLWGLKMTIIVYCNYFWNNILSSKKSWPDSPSTLKCIYGQWTEAFEQTLTHWRCLFSRWMFNWKRRKKKQPSWDERVRTN